MLEKALGDAVDAIDASTRALHRVARQALRVSSSFSAEAAP
jgi:hypothetical protein